MTASISTETRSAPNWRHVAAFIGLTFGLTWLLDLVIYLRGGLNSITSLTVLQFQMLLPAFSAIVLGLFFFRESPIHVSRNAGRGRWFYYYFLGLTVIFGIGVIAAWFTDSQATIAVVSSILQLLAVVGLLLLVILRLVAGRDAMARVWLSWGNWRNYLVFGLAIVAYYILQAVLNVVFRIPMTPPAGLAVPPGMSPTTFWIVGGVQTVLLAPILAIVISFGEEYGWRGYLQNELFKWGRARGVLLLGVIWGAWHWPLILMGYNYPGYPVLGVLLMTLYTIGLAVVLGYAVLRSGSVLLAAYLHALNNQFLAFVLALGYNPTDRVFSFNIGIYGIVTLAIVTFLILRDPVWRGRGSNLPEPGSEA